MGVKVSGPARLEVGEEGLYRIEVRNNGTVPLTAFIPNDRAFQVLAYDLTKKWPSTEEKAFNAIVAAAGVDLVEQVLLYHVVPGATITKRDAVRANGATLTTAQGDTFTVRVYNRWVPVVELRDQDRIDFGDLVHPEDRQRVDAALHAAVRGDAPYAIEYRLALPDGRVAWLDSRAVLVRDEHGRPKYWQGVAIDVTAHRELETRYRDLAGMLFGELGIDAE